ncbi:NADPH--hemoprotein reductase NDAI_0C02110 [Naumovozyma dairenensis CBS 421]|uniref:NADPH--cytochrome P450 reductase n=1 Tax=Naumovozyma dairenensis (strain ATCC 10597 / BCRC 20456 / CBS 421 / NBRC 0211 / NRRL Y-12639) TaxID=1071378 RepID=G0W7W0_NAUDC|nr:hypothetical protein NDAI_0C02110 [Naumovozyma dairenensis CBS 421]CCD23871.1 hypothetical protein NDAI_0C02110 [Naumovozyma dairenensis CBS 421]
MDTIDVIVFLALLFGVALYLHRATIKDLFFSNDDELKAINSSGSRDLLQVLKEMNKNYLVLYASQTGTAEDYAKKFSKELISKFGLKVMCADIESYDYDSLFQLPSNIVISFFISTYGEGDFPDGSFSFEQFLTTQIDDEDNSLTNLQFTMFGLGNSTYEFFNGAAKKAVKYLKGANANLLGPFGEADDGSGTTDEDYISWTESVLEALKTVLNLDEHDQTFEPSFKYEILNEINDTVSLGEPSLQYLPINAGKQNGISFNEEGIQVGPFDQTHPYIAPITFSKELIKQIGDSKLDRNCVHAEIDISGSNLKYSTGDHVAFWPSNAIEKVNQFLSIFNLDGDLIFNLTPLDNTVKAPFLTPTTIRTAISHYLEITGPISRQFISQLVQFAPNESIKEKLITLSKDKLKFAQEITFKNYNIADALVYLSDDAKDVKWDSVPWNFLIETLPRLQPRYYSISSSSLSERQTVHITAIVEDSINELTNERTLGVTTNLLRNIERVQNSNNADAELLPVHYDLDGPRNLYQHFKLPIHIRRSTFKLPSNPKTPVIMIGPGTGIAPFRGFIRERVKFMENNPDNIKLGKHLLFYGSRNENDFLYKEEWPQYASKLGDSFEMIVAHSRIGDKKVYVQHKVKEYGEEIFKLLNDQSVGGAFIYVCGDAKGMAQDVQTTIVEILAHYQDISIVDALEIVKAMKTTGRYQEDVW